MTYDVQVHPAARKQLDSLPRKMQQRILEKINQLTVNPRPVGVVKLAGEDAVWRVRIGDYRVLYEIYDDKLVVLVIRIGHRKDVYRD